LMIIGMMMAASGYVLRRRLEPAWAEVASEVRTRDLTMNRSGNVVLMLTLLGILIAVSSYFSRRR
jgi:hypothetical protein